MEGVDQFHSSKAHCRRNTAHDPPIHAYDRHSRWLSRPQGRRGTRNEIHLARTAASRRYHHGLSFLRPPTATTACPRRLYLWVTIRPGRRGILSVVEPQTIEQ